MFFGPKEHIYIHWKDLHLLTTPCTSICTHIHVYMHVYAWEGICIHMRRTFVCAYTYIYIYMPRTSIFERRISIYVYMKMRSIYTLYMNIRSANTCLYIHENEIYIYIIVAPFSETYIHRKYIST